MLVPQGSILGPLLYLVYINDIVNEIESDIFLFADDTSILHKINGLNAQKSIDTINGDLSKLFEWLKQWHVTFNPKKTTYMIFSTRRNCPTYRNMNFRGTSLNQVKTHTHLGLTLNSKMPWSDHVAKICAKASLRSL